MIILSCSTLNISDLPNFLYKLISKEHAHVIKEFLDWLGIYSLQRPVFKFEVLLQFTYHQRPHLHEYVFIENDILLNENAKIVFIYKSFLYCFYIVLFGDSFQKLSFSVVFVWMQGENARKSLQLWWKRYEKVSVCQKLFFCSGVAVSREKRHNPLFFVR